MQNVPGQRPPSLDPLPRSSFGYPGDADLMTVDVRRLGEAVVVSVGGEVDLVTATRLGDALNTAVEAAPQVLVVDLDRVEFFTSVGLTALALVQRAATERGIDLRVVATSRATLRPLEIAGMLDDLATFGSRSEALAGT